MFSWLGGEKLCYFSFGMVVVVIDTQVLFRVNVFDFFTYMFTIVLFVVLQLGWTVDFFFFLHVVEMAFRK